MRPCPVCENPVVASQCEVCGHEFPAPAGPELPVPRLLELEVAVEAEGRPAGEPLAEFEPTRFAVAAVSEEWSEVEWERSQVSGVPEVPAGGLADLDPGREAPSLQHTPPSVSSVTCRYCRNVQASGLLCERCGFRLPWSLPRPSEATRAEAEAQVRCQQCGGRSFPRERCPSCGAVLAAPA